MNKYALPLLFALAANFTAAGHTETNNPIGDIKSAKPQFTISPIGRIETDGPRTFIRLDPTHQDGLLGLDEWSHIWVFYWFDRNDTPERRATLRVHPRGNQDNPLTGVFATRSPMRPNLIALSLCRVVSTQGTDIEIAEIDAFDQTPVIDIKPYTPGLDRPQGQVNMPRWAGRPAGQSRDEPDADRKRP